ncbi:MAG: hypothetical protein KC877_01985 [Candidatus Kaiserbacteria bacterium]|nr:hypothetical protein [Candidatus Kaiserbacteria bacterium]MCB9816195.1 hypothetical protein [Candidatus Nomurabacteria bacterium]
MPTKKTTKTAPAKKAAAKKVVKKAVKKAPAKKAAVKTGTKKPLVYASNTKSFWVKNGQVLNSLVALKDALEEMEKEVYVYHTGGDSNDFANWVEQVLCDNVCAADLAKAKTPKSAKTVVVKHLKYYAV